MIKLHEMNELRDIYKPFFTVVMASTMRSYATAAKGRKWKLLRAVESVIAQSFTHWELIVVADDCEETFQAMNIYKPDHRVNCSLIPHSALWSGHPRNLGIHKSKGRYIVYLDNDDKFGPDHLQIIYDQLQSQGLPIMTWFNDLVPKIGKAGYFFSERSIQDRGVFRQDGRPNPGTSNVCHRRDLNIWWDVPDSEQKSKPGYDHDYLFVKELMHYCRKNGHQIIKSATPQYHVCHIHKMFDV